MSAEHGKVNILVAEDSPTQAEKLAYILGQAGYGVTLAANGREALRLAEQHPPTLIISDIVMPEMNGYEFCRAIKDREALRRIPVILLTSLSDPVDVMHGLESGADNFIVKPYDEQYLLLRIASILANLNLRDTQMGVEVNFSGKKYFITSSRIQILNLLLSSYETAVHKNQQLIETQNELRHLTEYLEECVLERTAQLQDEIIVRRRAEDEVRVLNTDLEQRVASRTEELELANKELEAFSYSVSHDLRNPLGTIMGYSSIALNTADELPKETGEHLQLIYNASIRMTQLIEDLLNLSRVNRQDLRHENVDLTGMARGLMVEIEAEAPQRKVEFRAADGLSTHGDPNLLRIMLENLLRNAWKYSSKRDLTKIEFDATEKNGEPVYFVRDNGAGFGMESVDKLFGAFQRLHRADEFEGTGIGLTIVQRIVARHGGRIWAEGAVDQGATFFFTLPA